jgi:hypothetical protein
MVFFFMVADAPHDRFFIEKSKGIRDACQRKEAAERRAFEDGANGNRKNGPVKA